MIVLPLHEKVSLAHLYKMMPKFCNYLKPMIWLSCFNTLAPTKAIITILPHNHDSQQAKDGGKGS